jgi:hypothetical protein
MFSFLTKAECGDFSTEIILKGRGSALSADGQKH